MAELGDATSLIEVGLALNLAAPALVAAIGSARDAVLEPIVRKLRETDPDFHISSSRTAQLHKNLLLFYPWLRRLAKLGTLIAVTSATVAALSAGLLVLAAIEPERTISELAIVTYAAIALLAVPIAQLGTGALLRWFGRRVALELTDNPRMWTTTTAFFKAVVTSYERIEESWAELDEIMSPLRLISRLRHADRTRWSVRYESIEGQMQLFVERAEKAEKEWQSPKEIAGEVAP